MNADDTYLDVTVRSKGTFGKASEKTTRLHLPITWTVNGKPRIVDKETIFLALFGPSGIVLYIAGFKIFGVLVFIVYGWLGAFLLRSRWNLYKLGPGVISADKKGFSDSRLGPHQVLWSSVQKHRIMFDPKKGGPSSILIVSDDSRAWEAMSTRYKRAYLLPLKAKKAVFKLHLRGVENSQEIAQGLQILIEAAKFD